MNNYKQTCPECYYEVFLDRLEDKINVCPKCKGKKIAWQKIVKIKDAEQLKEEAKEENETKEPIWEEEFGISMVEDESVTKQEICLKYKNGIIKSDFEIVIKEDDTPCLLGRNGLGNKYFEYDTRISNEHFRIVIEQGIWKLVDEESTNGTLINGQLVQPYTKVTLKDGDTIKLGKTDTSTVLEVKINVVS